MDLYNASICRVVPATLSAISFYEKSPTKKTGLLALMPANKINPKPYTLNPKP